MLGKIFVVPVAEMYHHIFLFLLVPDEDLKFVFALVRGNGASVI